MSFEITIPVATQIKDFDTRKFKGPWWLRWLWEKLSTHSYVETSYAIKQVVSDDILEVLREAVVANRRFGSIDRIIMGTFHFHELQQRIERDGFMPPPGNPMSFLFWGIPVQILPHFDGILVVPKL